MPFTQYVCSGCGLETISSFNLEGKMHQSCSSGYGRWTETGTYVDDLTNPVDEDLLNDRDPKAVDFNKFFLATPEERAEFESMLVGNPRGDFVFILDLLRTYVRPDDQ